MVGAMWATRPAPAVLVIRLSAVVVAAATLAMGFVHGMEVWAVLRFVAGVARAWSLVYVSAWRIGELSGRKPVLTVTDASSGGQRGLIHFTNANGRVRFFIDQAGARQRGLMISSRLLALAVGVRQ